MEDLIQLYEKLNKNNRKKMAERADFLLKKQRIDIEIKRKEDK